MTSQQLCNKGESTEVNNSALASWEITTASLLFPLSERSKGARLSALLLCCCKVRKSKNKIQEVPDVIQYALFVAMTNIEGSAMS